MIIIYTERIHQEEKKKNDIIEAFSNNQKHLCFSEHEVVEFRQTNLIILLRFPLFLFRKYYEDENACILLVQRFSAQKSLLDIWDSPDLAFLLFTETAAESYV